MPPSAVPRRRSRHTPPGPQKPPLTFRPVRFVTGSRHCRPEMHVHGTSCTENDHPNTGSNLRHTVSRPRRRACAYALPERPVTHLVRTAANTLRSTPPTAPGAPCRSCTSATSAGPRRPARTAARRAKQPRRCPGPPTARSAPPPTVGRAAAQGGQPPRRRRPPRRPAAVRGRARCRSHEANRRVPPADPPGGEVSFLRPGGPRSKIPGSCGSRTARVPLEGVTSSPTG